MHVTDIVFDILYAYSTPFVDQDIRDAVIVFIIFPVSLIFIASIIISIISAKEKLEKNKVIIFFKMFFGLLINYPPLFCNK